MGLERYGWMEEWFDEAVGSKRIDSDVKML